MSRVSYNEYYINQYEISKYNKYLRDPKLLDVLRKNYISRDNDNAKLNGKKLLFQESLDHYVIKRIKNNPSLINTPEFKNYKEYLKNIFSSSKYAYFHNAFTLAFNSDELEKMLGKDFVEIRNRNIQPIMGRITNINNKIENNLPISQQELDEICNVYAFYRKNNKYHENLIKYIFNNLTKQDSNLKCSKYVLDAILSFLPKSYPNNSGFDPNNIRIIASDDDNIKVGLSSGNNSFLERKLFSNIDFKSINDSKSNYLKRGTDFTFLMVVANHEITHNYQNYLGKKNEFSDEGYMALIRNVRNKVLCDYFTNHDNDEIEIDATEKSWNICGRFYSKYLTDNKLKQELINNCKRNRAGTVNRRGEYTKISQNDVVEDTGFSDIIEMDKIIFDNPSTINDYPMLSTFYNKEGRLKPEYISIPNIGNSIIGSNRIIFDLYYYPNMILKYYSSLPEEKRFDVTNNIVYAYSKYLRKIKGLQYNYMFGLSGEYQKNGKFEDKKQEVYNRAKKVFEYLNIFQNTNYSQCMQICIENIEKMMNSVNISNEQDETIIR